MASINLTTLVLSDAVDPSDQMAFPLMSKLTVTPKIEGEVRKRAGGRLVSVSKPGLARQVDVYLPHCDRTQARWLEFKTGRTLLLRDDRERKFYVVYFEVDIEEIGHLDEANISLSMQQVTHPEGFVQAEDGSWVPVSFFADV